MKSTILTYLRSLPHPIFAFATTVLLGTFIFVIPAHGSGPPKKERVLRIITVPNQPIEIVALKVKGAPVERDRKFSGDKDWLNGMVVTIKNVSDRPIVFATLLVTAANEKDGIRTQMNGRDLFAAVDLMYGVRPLLPGEPVRSYSGTPLLPGETSDLVISERVRDNLYFLLRMNESSTNIPELTLRVGQVCWEGKDDLKWNHGFMLRRDRNDAMHWITVDPPDPSPLPSLLNHAAGKPKWLAARWADPKLAGVHNRAFNLLPTCNLKYDYQEVKLCNARDNG